MMNRLLDVLFGCRHKRLSRPVSPPARKGTPKGETYVVCLDCGRRFAYDMKVMRLGKRLES